MCIKELFLFTITNESELFCDLKNLFSLLRCDYELTLFTGLLIITPGALMVSRGTLMAARGALMVTWHLLIIIWKQTEQL